MGTYEDRFSSIHKFVRPLPIDDGVMQKACVRVFNNERHRRERTVDDEVREELNNHLRTGEFDLSNITSRKTWQQEYLDKFGGIVPINSNWICPHCFTEYGMGYPPIRCAVCGTISPFGELVEGRYFNK